METITTTIAAMPAAVFPYAAPGSAGVGMSVATGERRLAPVAVVDDATGPSFAGTAANSIAQVTTRPPRGVPG